MCHNMTHIMGERCRNAYKGYALRLRVQAAEWTKYRTVQQVGAGQIYVMVEMVQRYPQRTRTAPPCTAEELDEIQDRQRLPQNNVKESFITRSILC